jgi:hypothetical protein
MKSIGGVKRTEYREVVRELGKALNMNWAYGVELLEVDPKQLGTDTFDDGETKAEHNIPVDVARLQFTVEPENSTFLKMSATVTQQL